MSSSPSSTASDPQTRAAGLCRAPGTQQPTHQRLRPPTRHNPALGISRRLCGGVSIRKYERDARRFLADLRERFAKFGLALAEDKTRLIEFGRFAAQRRKRRGLGRPETFTFLGFVHMCATTRNGRFALRRVTSAKRVRAKLRELKIKLKRRMHLPIPEQGRWVASVIRGHLNYYAVPGNIHAVEAFRTQVIRLWYRSLRRRSQRTRLNWQRMNRLVTRWLPRVRIVHPWPSARFDAKTRGRSPVR